ncbi:class I SAM-dependent methyltransferase [Tunturiibacter empetritectus]|uniref:Ubiquinone/menaquinone biosynthesis C-methylase UbiE n=2 Tax=Tunturiibacter TaxID=3154218 RepID=A0A852VBF9_9BACT|nr:ubiquinone/menaquinone biosynthesis C-methylase UbiE [Edaphobacter lichenicola]
MIRDHSDNLFEQCAWFYAICREYLFRDHTAEITEALFPEDGPLSGTYVLEVGCGPGFYSRRLAQRYPTIRTMGIDMSARLLEWAKVRASNLRLQNCSFREGDAQALPELNAPVDAVICSRLLLIVPDREAVLAEVFRILRPGGRCFFAEPTSAFKTRIPLLGMHLAANIISRSGRWSGKPHKAEVLCHKAFCDLIHTQPWKSVSIQSTTGYQYAVCQKPYAEEDLTLEGVCERVEEHTLKNWSVA